jgi:hypothetical protein
MNRTAHRETQYHQAVHKLITSLHCKRYRPSGMLIHRQNSYAPCSWRYTGRREAQSRERINKINKLSVRSSATCSLLGPNIFFSVLFQKCLENSSGHEHRNILG